MTWLVTEALGALSGAFGGAERVPNFLRAIVEEPGRFPFRLPELKTSLTTTDSFVKGASLVTADPVAWAYGHLSLNLAMDRNPLVELKDLLAAHGLEDRYRLETFVRGLSGPVEKGLEDRPAVIEGGIAPGLLTTSDQRAIRQVIDKIHRRLRVVADRVHKQLATADDRFLTVMDLVLEGFTTQITIIGFENIPTGGRLVFAPNHPFAFTNVDLFPIITSVVRRDPRRPWRFMGRANVLNQHMPRWREDPHFADRLVELEVHYGGPLQNGAAATQASIDFLRSHDDAMFFIGPEGPDARLQDRIAQPHPFFASLAAEGGAQIVPVLVTGEADLDLLAFKVDVRILPAWPVESVANVPHLGLTTQKWMEVLRAALRDP